MFVQHSIFHMKLNTAQLAIMITFKLQYHYHLVQVTKLVKVTMSYYCIRKVADKNHYLRNCSVDRCSTFNKKIANNL